MVGDIQQRHKFAGGLKIARFRWMTIARRIGRGIAALRGGMFDHAVAVAVMITRGPVEIVRVGIAAVGGEHVVEVKHEHVVLRIAAEPVIHQPIVEGAGVSRASCIGVAGSQRRSRNDDEQTSPDARRNNSTRPGRYVWHAPRHRANRISAVAAGGSFGLPSRLELGKHDLNMTMVFSPPGSVDRRE